MGERELSPILECAFCMVVGVEYIRLLHWCTRQDGYRRGVKKGTNRGK